MAWYRTGTIAVTGKKVVGTSTNFIDSKFGIGAGQALLIPASGTVKMYEIASVEDATHLTLLDDAGAVPAGQVYAVLSFYTDSRPDFAKRLAAQLSYYQSQMDGWQDIMTGTGTISITAPNGTVVNISSFSKLTSDMSGKAAKGANSDITSISGLTTSLTVPQGGTGGNTQATARSGLGLGSASVQAIGTSGATVPLLSTANTWGAGQIINASSFAIAKPESATGKDNNQNMFYMASPSGAYSYCRQNIVGPYNALYFALGVTQGAPAEWGLYLRQNGDVVATSGQFIGQSDKRIKDRIEAITDPLTKMRNITGSKWMRLDTGRVGFGFIAQDVQQDFPEAVSIGGTTSLKDGTEVEDTLVVDTNSVAAALHHQAILALMDEVDKLKAQVIELQASK